MVTKKGNCLFQVPTAVSRSVIAVNLVKMEVFLPSNYLRLYVTSLRHVSVELIFSAIITSKSTK